MTTGGYNAEYLELTDKGRKASSTSSPDRVRLTAQADLAISSIQPFQDVYNKFNDGRLPNISVLGDAFKDAGVPDEHVSEATETFLANCREVGLINTIGGAEWLLSVGAALDNVRESPAPGVETSDGQAATTQTIPTRTTTPRVSIESPAMDRTCFIVTPIGADNSEFRKHADLVLHSLIEPALLDLGLEAVRADQISKPGMITAHR